MLCLVPFRNIAQTTERSRPEAWKNLIYGGRFMDRFLPMQNNGKPSRNDAWGAEGVLPRYVENGIESSKLSLWCADIKYDNGNYHMFVVGWPESSPKGHETWPSSTLYHATSNNMTGPFIVQDTIGKGHNSIGIKLKNGRWIVYVIDGYYIADSPNGPWTYNKFDFQNRDRKINDDMSNCVFAQREDGSYMMINRGGGVWFSQTGESTYNQISEKSIYPNIKGSFEDPIVWRDNVQYNLIVNDWYGRIAYYLRSKDGQNWKTESGEAYMPGIAKHADGTKENWWKYERMNIFQDNYGRAIQANFAVIDVEKNLDKPNDSHSSKNITIPLMPGRLITILNKTPITSSTRTVRIKIAAEKGFDPQKDIDFSTLNFGASEDVNYGRGFKVMKTEELGRDAVITFNVSGKNISDDGYAAKLLGKTKSGHLVFGYALLPEVEKIEPILSSRLPVFTPHEKGLGINILLENFGQVSSKNTDLKITYLQNGKQIEIANGKIPPIKPFGKAELKLTSDIIFEKGKEYALTVVINPNDKSPVTLHNKMIPIK